MKKRLLFPLGLIAFSMCISSCHKDDDNSPAPTVLQDTTPIVNGMKDGTWHVTYYSDHNDDQTDHFAGYNFTFGSGNVLTATDGTNTYTGTWNVTNFNHVDESPNDFIDFNIFFSAPPDFEDISDDWDIMTRTDTKIEMIDVDPDPTKTDYITFEKN